MEEIINRIKKMNISTIIIIVFLIIIIIVNLTSGTGNNNNNNKIVTFNYTKENTTDIYAIINALQAKINKLEKEINQKQTLNFLGGLSQFKGKIKSKKLLPDGSMIITTKDGKKYLIHPDGTVEEIKDYKINPDGTVSIIKKNGEVVKIKPKNSTTVGNNGTKNNEEIFKKLKKIPDNISEIVDENGNRYFKDKDGNWYMITPDGKKVKLGKDLKIDSNGNIIVGGKKLGKVYSMKTKSGIMLDKNGNVYQAVEEAESTNTNKLSSIDKKLNSLAAKHGGITDKKLLADGSMLVTTADGKKYLIHPDGTVEEIKDYKINPDGTATIIGLNNKKIKKKISKQEEALKNLLNGKNIKEKHYLADGSMLITTSDGKKYLVHPDGTIEEIKDYKDNGDGTFTIVGKNGKIINAKAKAAEIEKVKKGLIKKHGKIVDSKLLADGSLLVTTADGKKFLIHPDGSIEEVKDYKINPDGTVSIKTMKSKKIISQLNPNDFLISNIIDEHGELIGTDIDKKGNLLLIPYDKVKFYISNANVHKVISFTKTPELNYIKVITENGNFDMYYGLENILLNNYLKNEKSFVDFHELKDNSVLFTTKKNNKYLITPKGEVKPLDDYKINPDGTVTIIESGELKMSLSRNNIALKNLLKKGKKIVDKKLLADGSMLVTTADGKKYLIHPDGTVEEIKDYKVNPDGTVSIIDKNGKLKVIKGPKFLKKIFVDKDGRKYLLDENGNKHYIKDGYIDKNGNLVYTDLNGNVHVLKNTGKKVILKTTPKGEHEVVGIGDIVDINGKKMLVIKKIFYKKTGYPIEYLITLKNIEYLVKNNNVYLNNTKLGKGFIYLKDNKFIISFNNNKKIIDKNEVKSYKIMPLYYTNQNGNLMFRIIKNTIYILNSNGKIEKLDNVVYKTKKGKLIVSFLGTKNKKDYLIKNNLMFPLYKTKNLKLLELPYSYYIFDNTNLIYKIFIENIKPEYYSNNIKLVNDFGIKILGLYQNKQKTKFSDDLKYLEYNGLYYHNSLADRFNKNLDKLVEETYGYKLDNILFANAKGNVVEITPNSYFVIPGNKVFTKDKIIYTKSYFKEIDVNNIQKIEPKVCLANKGIIIKLNGKYYVLNDNGIESLGTGNLEVSGNNVLLSGIVLGKTCRYGFEINNGYIMKPVITTEEIKNINKLNNVLNKYFAILDYGVKVYFTDGGMTFYNDKLEVIYVKPDASVKNLGKGKIILNKQNRYVYFVNNNGKYEFLGIMKSRVIENNLLVITTDGKYYINKNMIFQVLKNNVLNNLMLAPDLENGYLYGFNRQKILNLGKILEIYKANLVGKNLKILNNGINYLKNNPEGNVGLAQNMEGKTIVGRNGKIGKNLIVENGMVFKIKNGKKILLGKLNTAGKKFIVIKDKKTGKNIVVDKNGNVITFVKKENGQIIMKKNGRRFVPGVNSGIKIKNGKVYIDGHLIRNLKFVNEYRRNNKPSIKLLSPQEFENLFAQETQKKKKIIESKPKFNVGNNLNQQGTTGGNLGYNENPATYRYEVITSNTAIKRNEKLFLNNDTKPIIINADTGEITSDMNSVIANKYFLIPGIKIPVTLVGGSLAPLTQLAQPADSMGGGGGQNPIANFIPNSFFVITKNITLPSGKVIPMNRGIIVAKPIPTTAQRMFYQCKSIYFYDENTDKWYQGQAAGQIVSAVDNVPGLPGILIDTRNKYIAKAAIYSILEGVSKFINNVHSPLDAMQNATQTDITPPSVGGTLGTTLLGGASGQLKNLSNLFMAIIKSQVPYLAVQNGEKGYFITDNVIRFSNLNIGN